jgi:Asp-tRNA(Asn)/Glu-tRNA(Gln) amidotransferase B subunit
VLTSSRQLADYFEPWVRIGLEARICANWVTRPFGGTDNRWKYRIAGQPPASGRSVGAHSKRHFRKIAKQVFEEMWQAFISR